MPQIIAGNVDSKSAATAFVDVRGKKATVIADDLPVGATGAQVLAYQNAIGNMSNAAVFSTSYHENQIASITGSTAYDDAESSVTTGANMIFQNTVTLAIRSFRVPAVDASLIDNSGDFLKDVADASAPLIGTAVTAILAMLGGSWVYVKGTISTRARGSVQGASKPLVAEPAGITPPPEPGV